ncbi:MAG TPA: hypothetical protein PKH33_02750 [bacterium]|nr:hypothetical protein [bacterium]
MNKEKKKARKSLFLFLERFQSGETESIKINRYESEADKYTIEGLLNLGKAGL